MEVEVEVERAREGERERERESKAGRGEPKKHTSAIPSPLLERQEAGSRGARAAVRDVVQRLMLLLMLMRMSLSRGFCESQSCPRSQPKTVIANYQDIESRESYEPES